MKGCEARAVQQRCDVYLHFMPQVRVAILIHQLQTKAILSLNTHIHVPLKSSFISNHAASLLKLKE